MKFSFVGDVEKPRSAETGKLYIVRINNATHTSGIHFQSAHAVYRW